MNYKTTILQNIQRQKSYFPPEAKPKEKQKIHVSLHICIFIHATRNYKQKIIAPHTTTTTPSPRMQKQKFKKKPGELITHHPFVDDVGRNILSHHHQWCSSSCFPTWEVQILEHIVHLKEKKLFDLRTKIQVRANSNNQSQRVIERFVVTQR